LSKENFDLAFGLFQLLAARRGKLQPFFKKLQRLLKRHIALLELIYDLFQPLKTLFKFGHRVENSIPDFTLTAAGRPQFFLHKGDRLERLTGSTGFTLSGRSSLGCFFRAMPFRSSFPGTQLSRAAMFNRHVSTVHQPVLSAQAGSVSANAIIVEFSQLKE
jgi:hypothetical protein